MLLYGLPNSHDLIDIIQFNLISYLFALIAVFDLILISDTFFNVVIYAVMDVQP